MIMSRVVLRLELLVAVCALSVLVGCVTTAPSAPGALETGTQAPIVVNMPQNPEQAVYAAKFSLLAGLAIVADYRKLPPCGPGVILCKNAAMEKRLQALSNAGDEALNEAEKAVRTPGFAQDALVTLTTSATLAVKALTTITDTLRTK